MSVRVLVTQATGRVGRETVAHLAEQRKQGKDVFIRAVARDSSKDEWLRSLGADEVVRFDYNEPSTFAGALDNMNSVFSASPDPACEGHDAFCKTFSKDIQHVVRLSCFGADTLTASYDPNTHATLEGEKIPGMLQGYWRDEKCVLDNVGVEKSTVLRANFFQGHIIKPETGNIDEHGFFSSPLGSARNSFVSTNDIGEAAAIVLANPATHMNKFYDLTGPEPTSMYDCAEILSKALGKKVEYREQDIEKFEADFGKQRRAFFEYLRNGFYLRCSPDFYNITGKKPQGFYEYLTVPGKSGETGLDEMWKGGMWTKGKNAMEGHEA